MTGARERLQLKREYHGFEGAINQYFAIHFHLIALYYALWLP